MGTQPVRRREKERLLALSFCRADLLFELDLNQNIEYAAGATEILLGKTSDDLYHSAFLDIVHQDDQKMATELLNSASGQGRLDDVTVHLKSSTNSKIPVILSGYRVPDFNNHFFLALKVNTKKQKLGQNNALKRDEDSNLLDAKSFSESAAERVTSFMNAGGEAQVSMVKLNHLDDLLTKIGASDKQKLMTEIGNVLKENSIGGDTASRLDGDSFSYIHTTSVNADNINDQLEKVAAKAHPDGEKVQAISNTLDIDGAGMSEDQVARALIYTMQSFCQNQSSVKQTSISDVLSSLMSNTVENVNYIKSIINKRDVDIHFMPIVHLKENYVHHFEGLLRFKGERAGESPYNIVRLAEEVDIICDLDMSVIKKTIERIRYYNKTGFIPPVAINLSGLSLSNATFMQQLNAILRNSPEISGQLMFEITESAKIDDLPVVNNLLQSIRKMGFEVCLDDFGSGAASFDYINALDVDVVKFDGPVVKRAYSSDKGSDLLRAMSNMCHDLNIHTVAEMIEDETMAIHMKNCGIDFGQGWHFGKAVADPLQYKNNFNLAARL
jgi:EAL domain-containing protein (putative c-di-GMP-specific phosphodiesterase class I)